MQPRRRFKQLKGTAGDTVTIDITGSDRKATFRFDNIDAKVGSHWAYASAIWLFIRYQVDQPAMGGSIIRPDQLYRILSSITLSCADLGQIYAEGDLDGPSLGLIAQVIGNGYKFPYQLAADIAAADGDTAGVLPIRIPLAQMCFLKGHQTAIWNGFLKNNGQLEVNLAASTALAAVSTGAALEATTDVRAVLEYTIEPEARPPVVWTWRKRTTPGGETKHTIRNLCQGKGLNGVTQAGKLAFLAWLTDQNGLPGPDGVDIINRVQISDLDQPSIDLGSPFRGTSPFLYGFVSDLRDTVLPGDFQSDTYPFALGTAVSGAPNVATAYFQPYIWPDPRTMQQEVSKLTEWSGDLTVEHDYSSTPANASHWLTLETSYFTEEFKAFLMGARMGLPPEQFTLYPKVKALHDGGDGLGRAEQAKKLRAVPEKVRAR